MLKTIRGWDGSILKKKLLTQFSRVQSYIHFFKLITEESKANFFKTPFWMI